MFNLATIKVRAGETFEAALRRFNREVQKDGVLNELRDREHYQKPSQIKAKKKKDRARKLAFEKRNKK